MPVLPKMITDISLYLLLLIASWFTLKKLAVLSSEYQVIARNIPYIVLPLSMLLSYQFNRSRSFSVALALLLSYWTIQTYLQTPLSEPPALYIYSAISLLLPLCLTVLIVTPERGIRNRYGMWSVGAVVSITFLAVSGYHYNLGNAVARVAVLQPKPYAGYVLSIAASTWILLFFIATTSQTFILQSKSVGASLFSFLISAIVLIKFYQPFISTVLFSTAAMALMIEVVRTSHQMAYRDDLTGLRGRRAFNEHLQGLGKLYTIAMLDVDHFKRFNDSYGHDVGDNVLQMVATHIGRVGSGGIAYRYGGEEFSIIFPNRRVEDCIDSLERLRENIANYELKLRDKKNRPQQDEEGKALRGGAGERISVSVTISIGTAQSGADVNSPQEVVKTADNALYAAKKQGRNCIETVPSLL